MSQKFHQWLAAYQDDAWSLATYLLKDRAEAEDVTQEAFIKLWKRPEPLSEAEVRPWLLTVVRNACLDRLRHLKLVLPVQDTEAPPPESVTEQQELAARLEAAITGLQEPHRSLVVLRDVQQLSYAEVAEITGLNLSQVKVYLHRARLSLRAQLAEMQP